MENIILLIKFIGIVFFSAGIHRIFYKSQREYEIYNLLNLPKYTDILILIFEIVGGIILLFDLKYVKETLIALLVFCSMGVLLLLINNFDKIMSTYNELFTLKADSLSFFLHITYLLIIVYILLSLKN